MRGGRPAVPAMPSGPPCGGGITLLRLAGSRSNTDKESKI